MRTFTDEERKANRGLEILAVLECLKSDAPEVHARAEVVGRWVWVSFGDKPAADVRAYLSGLGFRWSRRRQAWQHACGRPSTGSKGHPKDRYGSVLASMLDDAPVAVA